MFQPQLKYFYGYTCQCLSTAWVCVFMICKMFFQPRQKSNVFVVKKQHMILFKLWGSTDIQSVALGYLHEKWEV